MKGPFNGIYCFHSPFRRFAAIFKSFRRQSHQHFTISFCINFLLAKKLKIKTINTFKLEELFYRQKAARKMLVKLKKYFFKALITIAVFKSDLVLPWFYLFFSILLQSFNT